MADFELVWDSRCVVAESPVWDPATRRVLFADIMGIPYGSWYQERFNRVLPDFISVFESGERE